MADATSRLPERHREALALRESLRLSHGQIAQAMGIEPAAVAPLLGRARLQLRAERRGGAIDASGPPCGERERAWRLLALRQDSEPLGADDDAWLHGHLDGCEDCRRAHAAMLEASACYRAWRISERPGAPGNRRDADDVVNAPARRLLTATGELALGGGPWLMGIVNATPDSFSDGALGRSLEDRVALAAALLEAGADVIDVGGESRSHRSAARFRSAEEIERVVPVIERVRGRLGALVSVDTYKPAVASRRDRGRRLDRQRRQRSARPAPWPTCAPRPAPALVLMHTRAAPKQKLLDPSLDGRAARDVEPFLRERIDARARAGRGDSSS